jgi:hypothetical protein
MAALFFEKKAPDNRIFPEVEWSCLAQSSSLRQAEATSAEAAGRSPLPGLALVVFFNDGYLYKRVWTDHIVYGRSHNKL